VVASAEWLDADYYRVLGVPETATAKEITAAYRRLARRLHPDAQPDGEDGAAFRDVAAAYAVLHDEQERREYDEFRRLTADGGAQQRAPGDRARGQRVRVRRPGDSAARGGRRTDPGGPGRTDDLFGGDVLGGEGSGWPTPRRSRRGADVTAELTLDLADAVRGTTRRLTLTEQLVCSSCAGTGARPGTRSACPVCGGSGVRSDTRTVTARIPAGVADGQTLDLRGHGSPGTDGGPPGDLRIKVRVRPHPVFTRSGDDLAETVPITFAEAALGADVRVPTLDEPVTVRVPPGTATGTTFRVRGRGVRAGGRTGDLRVTLRVEVPTDLTDEQRAAVEALAAAFPRSPRGAFPH
jgi:molecular chaperone DnaJ